MPYGYSVVKDRSVRALPQGCRKLTRKAEHCSLPAGYNMGGVKSAPCSDKSMVLKGKYFGIGRDRYWRREPDGGVERINGLWDEEDSVVEM